MCTTTQGKNTSAEPYSYIWFFIFLFFIYVIFYKYIFIADPTCVDKGKNKRFFLIYIYFIFIIFIYEYLKCLNILVLIFFDNDCLIQSCFTIFTSFGTIHNYIKYYDYIGAFNMAVRVITIKTKCFVKHFNL